MLTRAIITDVDLSNSKVQLRIPWIDGVYNSGISPMSDSKLSWASIMCLPGMDVDYHIGDVVIVSFEDNNIGKPIVLGFLKLIDKEIEPRIFGSVQELSVMSKLTAPTNTTIGKTNYDSLFNTVDSLSDDTLLNIDDGMVQKE